MTSTQTLSDQDRRAVARWALACAERVLPLFEADAAAEDAVRDAVARTRAYAAGEGTAAEGIRLRFVAGRAAGAATTPAGVAAARAVAQAAAVSHMGAHALGAAAYAAKAVSLARPDDPEAVRDELRRQVADLDARERAALRLLPPLGADPSGPLGAGLLSRGILGSAIREIQAQVGTAARHEEGPVADLAYPDALRRVLERATAQVSARLEAIRDAATPDISGVVVEVFVDQDGEGPFDVWARFEGPDASALDLRVGDAREVFGVVWQEDGWAPPVPARPCGWSREDLEQAVVEVVAAWIDPVVPASSAGLRWRVATPGGAVDPIPVGPRG